MARPLSIVCLASYFKGAEFIRECKRLGGRVSLLIREKLRDEDWPRGGLDDLISLPDQAGADEFIDTVARLARTHGVDRVVALEEFDVLTAAAVREHFLLPGLGLSAARVFRDKLAMRTQARATGIPVPEFTALFHPDDIRRFMETTPAPWVKKPRSDVSAIGIQVIRDQAEALRAIEESDRSERSRERSSYRLLERFIAGGVYHVDSLVADGRVQFAGVNRYRRPPMDVAQHGGVFVTHSVEHGSADERELLVLNRALLEALGLTSGAAHAEYIRSDEDGRFYFLEVAARVGGAYIAEVLDAATGINIWREWARLECATAERPYVGPVPRARYGGVALSLARQEWPDTSAYTDPEIVERVKKHHHAGLIVSSDDYQRVMTLVDGYTRRFADDFSAVLPPLARPE